MGSKKKKRKIEKFIASRARNKGDTTSRSRSDKGTKQPLFGTNIGGFESREKYVSQFTEVRRDEAEDHAFMIFSCSLVVCASHILFVLVPSYSSIGSTAKDIFSALAFSLILFFLVIAIKKIVLLAKESLGLAKALALIALGSLTLVPALFYGTLFLLFSSAEMIRQSLLFFGFVVSFVRFDAFTELYILYESSWPYLYWHLMFLVIVSLHIMHLKVHPFAVDYEDYLDARNRPFEGMVFKDDD